MQRQYLDVDAFLLPSERKEEKIHYQKLYPNSPLFDLYPKQQKEESQNDISQRENFQKQFFQLLDAYKIWGQQNNCLSPDISQAIDTLKINFFEESYSGSQTADYFSVIKKNLERIWSHLEKDEKELPKNKKREAYQQLCRHMQVCAPGFYTHVEDALNVLTTDISLERWLAELRTQFIRQYSDIHCYKKRVEEGNSIHAYNAFLVYAMNDGIAPLSKINKINDPFIAAHSRIDESDVATFFNKFYEFYSPNEIINCITTNFFYEMNQIKNELSLNEKNGWIATTPDFLKRIQTLANIIGVPEMTFFDFSEDALSIRFNPALFKTTFLKANKEGENKKIFRKELWQEISLGKYKLKMYAHDIDLAWLEEPYGLITNWQTLFEDNDPVMLYTAFLQNSKKEDWPLIENCLRQFAHFDLINNLDKIVHQLPKEPLFQFFENHKYLMDSGNLFNNPNDLEQFLKQLNNEQAQAFYESWLPELVKKLVIKNDAVFLKIILTRHYAPSLETYRTEEGDNYYHLAVKHDNFNIVNILPLTKLDINAKNKMGETPAHLAATISHRILLKLLDHKADYEIKNLNGQSVTLLAVQNTSSGRTLDGLIKHKANFNFILPNRNALHIAADIYYDLEDVARIKNLIELKADANQPDEKEGLTPLHRAVHFKHYLIVDALLEAKANPDVINLKGHTPLHMAAEACDYALLSSLIGNKANVEIADPEGYTAAHFVIEQYISDPQAKNRRACIDMLIEAKVNLSKPNKNGISPLSLAYGTDAFDRIMLFCIAKVERYWWHVQSDKWNLAHVMANAGKVDVLKLAIETKSDINQKNIHEKTPIMLAIEADHPSAVKFLLENKAELDPKLLDLKTLITNNKWEMVVFLLRRENDISPEIKTLLETNRNHLKTAFIKLNKEMTKQESDNAVHDLLHSNNALGIILNKPHDKFSHIFYKKFHHGLTKEVFEILNELKYEEQSIKKMKPKK